MEANSMPRIDLKRAGVLGAWLAALILLGAGAGKTPPKKNSPPLKVDETVSDLAILRTNTSIRVEGVGLVIGLDGTGSTAEPSAYRTKLLSQMRKERVEHAERWLESPLTSLVLVKGTIPAGITTKDHFDVEIELPPASTTSSLAGGYLLITELTMMQRVKEGDLEGQAMGWAGGPIMIGNPSRPEDKKVGRVLGGARVKKDQPYTLVLKDERRSGRTAKFTQDAINQRFHQLSGIDQKGMASAKSDQIIILNVPRVYHQNQYRYFQVIEHLPILDSPDLRAQRQARWGKELLDPKMAGVAALKLEGIGRNAIDTLKPGLASPNAQVRFFAAEALAYLNDTSGVQVLRDSVVSRPDFRLFGLAALAAMDQSASILALRELMNQPDPKVRYGAFNALRSIAEDDPFLGRVRVAREEPEDTEARDALALQIESPAARRRKRVVDPFELYVVDCEGPPLIHLARTRRCEIVIFGRNQKLMTPIVLGGAGPIFLNASLGNKDTVEISRIGAGGPDSPDLKVTTSLNLADVIRETANLGATYPDILKLLQDAQRQRNLLGKLEADALPEPLGGYDEAQLAGVDKSAKKDAAVGKAGFEKEKRPRKSLLDRLRGR
jgi:flagellar basal body P-ring protein FlgI